MNFLLRPMNRIDEFFNKNADPRVANLPMTSSILPTLAIVATYIYAVKILGPRLMENRKPFKLKNVLLVYNFLQVLLSIYIFYEVSSAGWFNGYSYRCEPIDYSNKPDSLRILHVCWVYYIAKFTELLDTIFFVMRKKYDQVSVLHVFHHAIMPVNCWIGVKFVAGGHGTFFGFLNSFVHIVMYGYYFLSALGPKVQKYLWWKKYLTGLQMLQFATILVHTAQLFFITCDYPKGFAWAIMCEAMMFYFLFRNFYKQRYSAKARSA